ncbi:MAG: septal ring lytic transglycosylase RlpA family protein [Cyanobacteria bacterium]|nr:septal ring lytic transglycosylase RlpA family protein [Cyanobacteria bacterium bin.51]
MPSSLSLGALALLLSSSGVAIPAFADSTKGPQPLVLAMSSEQPAQAKIATSPSGNVVIRDVQDQPDFEPVVRPVVPQAVASAPSQSNVRHVTTGEASWYGPGFFGNRTANGEIFRPGTLTAAHRTLPFGTRVRVTNLRNGRITYVRINDRGPFVGNRVIDLAHGAAQKLGLISSGIAQVRLEVLQ